MDLAQHFPASEIAGEENQALFEIDRGVVAQPENALIEHAQQQAGERGGSLLDFVEQDQRQFAVLTGAGIEALLGEHGLGLAVAQIAGRRTDQLGDFVLELELAAVHLEHVLFRAVQRVGQSFDGFGFAGASGSEQQENADRTPLRSEASLEHLDVGNDQPRGVGLADHLAG